MKNREIILDFTSLLDVIMIILFFFVIYSKLDSETATSKAKEAEQTYNQMIADQQEMNDKAARELQRIRSADENAAVNQKLLSDFNKGDYFALNLDEVKTSDDWKLKIIFNYKTLAEIIPEDDTDLKASIRDVWVQSGLDNETPFICVLSFDGNAYGTAGAVKKVDEALKSLQREYKNMYFSSNNISK